MPPIQDHLDRKLGGRLANGQSKSAFHALVHDVDVGFAEPHFDKILENALAQNFKAHVVRIYGAHGRPAETVAGGTVIEGGRNDDGRTRRNAGTDLLDDDGVVADGHVGPVGFDAAGRQHQRVPLSHGLGQLIG